MKAFEYNVSKFEVCKIFIFIPILIIKHLFSHALKMFINPNLKNTVDNFISNNFSFKSIFVLYILYMEIIVNKPVPNIICPIESIHNILKIQEN